MIFLLACENSKETVHEKDYANYSITEYISRFEGTWIDTKYYNALIESKSPYLASQKSPYYLIFICDEYSNDTFIGVYDYYYGQTESSPLRYFKPVDKTTLEYVYLTFNDRSYDSCLRYCPQIRLINSIEDTFMLVDPMENKGASLYKISTCSNSEFGEITNFITANILSGKYIFLDSSGQIISEKLIINEKGYIEGSAKLKRAILWDNFQEVNSPYNFDVLQFIPADSDGNDYGFYRGSNENIFKFEAKADTIQLRATKYNEEDWNVDVGSVMYYLVKQ